MSARIAADSSVESVRGTAWGRRSIAAVIFGDVPVLTTETPPPEPRPMEPEAAAAREPPAAGGRRRHFAVYLPALIGGGAERVAALLATGLRAAGHRVTLVVDFEAAANDHLVDRGVERVTLAGVHASDVLRLAGFIRQQQPDILLGIGSATNIKLALAHVLARLGGPVRTRIVLSYHGPSNYGTGWLGWAGYPLAWLLTRYAACTVCVSDDLMHHLVEAWRGARERIVRIYNPVAVDRTRPVAGAVALAARPPRVVAVGRLSTQKDYVTLIWAFAMLRRTDVRLSMYGEGPERRTLQQLAEQLGVARRIDWRGYVREPWDAYVDARCFVLSSRNESFGNVVVEALASGLPVVSTACGGPNEILEGGRFGTLVPVGDACALSLAMALTLEQPGDPGPRVERAKDFAVPKITALYLAMFEEVLSA